MSLNEFLGKFPTHQGIIASGLIEGFLTMLALGYAGAAGREVNQAVLIIWLGFVGGEIAGGAFAGYGKRTTDAGYTLAKKGIVPPTLIGVTPAPTEPSPPKTDGSS